MSKRQPVYLRTVRLIDPQTGAEVSAFVPAGHADASTIRERGITIGNTLRADITRPRNVQFHRLAHAIGGLVAQNIEAFEGMGQHQALKQLQFESGVECDVTRTEVPGVGVLESKRPRSLAFDAMEQSAFYEFVAGVCGYIARTYWPMCTPEQVEQMAEAMVREAA